jgi:hypothetical protein
MRSIRLDASVYREVAAEARTNAEAVLVAVLVALLAAAGQGLGALRGGRPLAAFLFELASTLLLGWLLWAVIAYVVGRMVGGKGTLGPWPLPGRHASCCCSASSRAWVGSSVSPPGC